MSASASSTTIPALPSPSQSSTVPGSVPGMTRRGPRLATSSPASKTATDAINLSTSATMTGGRLPAARESSQGRCTGPWRRCHVKYWGRENRARNRGPKGPRSTPVESSRRTEFLTIGAVIGSGRTMGGGSRYHGVVWRRLAHFEPERRSFYWRRRGLESPYDHFGRAMQLPHVDTSRRAIPCRRYRYRPDSPASLFSRGSSRSTEHRPEYRIRPPAHRAAGEPADRSPTPLHPRRLAGIHCLKRRGIGGEA